MNQKFKYKPPSSPKGKYYSDPLGPSIPLSNNIEDNKVNLYNKIDYFSKQSNYNSDRYLRNNKRRYDYSPICILRNAENNLNSTDMIHIKMGFDLLNHKIERINYLLDNPLTPLNQSFKNKIDNRAFSLNKLYDNSNSKINFKNSVTTMSTMDNIYSNNVINNTERAHSSMRYNSTQNLHSLNDYNNNINKKNLTISIDNNRKFNSISPEYNNNFSFRRENINNKYKKIISGRTFYNESNTYRNDNNNNIIHVNLKRSDNISFSNPLNTNRIYNESNFDHINSNNYSLRNKIKSSYNNYLNKNQNFHNSFNLNKNHNSFNHITSRPNRPKEKKNLEIPKYNTIQSPHTNLFEKEMKITVNKIVPKNNNYEIEGYGNQEYNHYYQYSQNNNIYNSPENSINLQTIKNPISLKIKDIKNISNINTPLIKGNLIQKDSSRDYTNKNNCSNHIKNEIIMENDSFKNNNDNKEIDYIENNNKNNIENNENIIENNIENNNENNNDINDSFQNNNFINNNINQDNNLQKKFHELKQELKNSISYISNSSHNKEMKEMPQDNYETKINKKNHKIILKDGEKEKVIEPDYFIIKDGEKEIKKIKINKNLIQKKLDYQKKKSAQNKQNENINQSNISQNLNKDNIENQKEKKNIILDKPIYNFGEMNNNQILENKANKNNNIKPNEISNNNINENINNEKEEENKILKKENNNIINNNINDNLKSTNNKNENSEEEEERIFNEITEKAKENEEKDKIRKHSKVQSDLETPKNELDNTNKLITFSEKHIIKFDGKETLTHLSIFDQNSTPQDKYNEFDIPTKLTPLIINSPSENKENEDLYNINSSSEKKNENIYIQENINNIDNFNNDEINDENINNNNNYDNSKDKQISLEKISQLIDDVNGSENNKQKVSIEENQNILIENNNENNNNENSNFNNNSEKTNNESDINNKDESSKTKNVNINNNININFVERQNKNKIHKPIKKLICPKFVNNPQQFFTEDLCENVLKSYDIPINLYNHSIQNSSNTSLSSNKNLEKTKKPNTVSQNNKIIVTRKLIPKNSKNCINNKNKNQEESNLKFNIYNFTTFGQNKH